MYALTQSWHQIARSVRHGQPARAKVRYRKNGLIHPSSVGYTRSLGLPIFGKIGDWRISLSDNSGIHIEEFLDHYMIHWDEVCPNRNLVGHAVKDAPVFTTFALGALFLGLRFLFKR